VPAVEVSSLVVRYGSVVAVDGVSLAAEAGQVHALLGPNGAGKTSTVETLEGYRQAASGTVRVLGLDPRADHKRLTLVMGVMLQRGGMYPGMNARDALRLTAAYYPDPADPEELLDRVGLRPVAKTAWRRLSGGEQQRVGLALALVGRPQVVFLDEPTAGVDPQARLNVREIIRGLADGGACVVLTTHDLDEAEKVADVITIIDHGRVVGSGTHAELAAMGGAADIRFAAPPSIDVGALGLALGCAVVEERAGEYRATIAGSPATVAALTAWLAERDLPLGDLRAGRRSLEEVFLRLTAEERQ
jgi:ABC-2 type transport system ATP-binding protein